LSFDELSADVFERAQCVVATEVLEHIEHDVGLLSRLLPETKVFFSVPNFDDSGHVRLFESEEQIVRRYQGVVDVHGVEKLRSRHWACWGVRRG
jgi:hypothetical protein